MTTAAGARERAEGWVPTLRLQLLCAAVSGVMGFAGWGPAASPAAVVALPLVWIVAGTRWAAGLVLASYVLTLTRYLPNLAGTWFASVATGATLWLGVGAVAFAVGAMCWSQRASPIAAALATLALTLVWLLAGAVMPAHPLIGWGYLLEGWHWIGVGLAISLTAASAAALRALAKRLPAGAPLAVAAVTALAAGALGGKPQLEGGKVAGPVGALSTKWGRYPDPYSLEVVQRIEKMGRASQQLAGGEGALETIVFPEAIVGRYEPSLHTVVEREILSRTAATGQTVMFGADVMAGRGRFQNAAIVLRPDGSSAWITARQSTPIAQWRPWAGDFHIPSDWIGPSVVRVGGGIKARVMFCHEELMPLLHLLSEYREEHHLVISLANLWATEDPRASQVQAQHTEGMARLFGRPWVRAVNGPRSSGATGSPQGVPLPSAAP